MWFCFHLVCISSHPSPVHRQPERFEMVKNEGKLKKNIFFLLLSLVLLSYFFLFFYVGNRVETNYMQIMSSSKCVCSIRRNCFFYSRRCGLIAGVSKLRKFDNFNLIPFTISLFISAISCEFKISALFCHVRGFGVVCGRRSIENVEERSISNDAETSFIFSQLP